RAAPSRRQSARAPGSPAALRPARRATARRTSATRPPAGRRAFAGDAESRASAGNAERSTSPPSRQLTDGLIDGRDRAAAQDAQARRLALRLLCRIDAPQQLDQCDLPLLEGRLPHLP